MSFTAAAALASLFGDGKQIGKIVADFDFSKINVKDSSREDYLTVKLAPAYGTLTSKTMQGLDDELKIMIAGTVKTIAKIDPVHRTWDAIMSAMLQSPLLEPSTDTVQRADKLIKSGVNVFKFDGSPDAAIVKEVQTWFVKLINDQDVLKSTQIDMTVLANIVAQTGATIDSFEALIHKSEKHEKTLVDIGVLRFPDIDNPHFKARNLNSLLVYRIKLTAWSSSTRTLMVQEDENGITGEFLSREFKPRKSIIKDMSEKAHDTAVSEADAMFA